MSQYLDTSGVRVDEHNATLHSRVYDDKWKLFPEKYFIVITHLMNGSINSSGDIMQNLRQPALKTSVQSSYWLFLMPYLLLALLGITLNIAIIVYISHHRLFRNATHAFIVNLCVCHAFQCALVLPISLMFMLLQNWIFGQFLCFFVPMLQDIPLHVSLLSHLVIAWDRLRWLRDPHRLRLPSFECCCATWLAGIIITLPYPIYTFYIELGHYAPNLKGIGLCLVDLLDDINNYSKWLFYLMYCVPVLLLAFMYLQTSKIFEPYKTINQRTTNMSHGPPIQNGTHTNNLATITANNGAIPMPPTKGSPQLPHNVSRAERSMHIEMRRHGYFGLMAAIELACICPLMVLRYAKFSFERSHDNQKVYDIAYLVIAWLAFLPTVLIPYVYATKFMRRHELALFKYLRLSASFKAKSRMSQQQHRCKTSLDGSNLQPSELDEYGKEYGGGYAANSGGSCGSYELGIYHNERHRRSFPLADGINVIKNIASDSDVGKDMLQSQAANTTTTMTTTATHSSGLEAGSVQTEQVTLSDSTSAGEVERLRKALARPRGSSPSECDSIFSHNPSSASTQACGHDFMHTLAAGRKQLPDIGKICAERSSTTASNLYSGSDVTSLSLSRTLSAKTGLTSSSLNSESETKCKASASDEDETPTNEAPLPSSTTEQHLSPNAVAAAAAAAVAAEYNPRKCHRTAFGHRAAKRYNFKSINGTDLMTGAFCEIDPTQPLDKMAIWEGRMRRSSPRHSSFTPSSPRNATKARGCNRGSGHSAHPELDFRENIFAEL